MEDELLDVDDELLDDDDELLELEELELDDEDDEFADQSDETELQAPSDRCGTVADWSGFDYKPEDFHSTATREIESLPETRVRDFEGKNEPIARVGVVLTIEYHRGKCQISLGIEPSNAEEPYGFTGKEEDKEVGLHYFGARYYSSYVGRWIIY